MAFISSAKNSNGKGEVNTASIPTASTQVSPASANVAAASISHDTVCTYIASQSNGSQIKYKDINQIDEYDIEEMDIKWNMALLRWDWSYIANEEENHALVVDGEALTEFTLMAKSISENEGFDNSLCSKSCKKNTDSLNTKYTDLREKLSDNDTITDYSRPSPNIESNSTDLQSSNSSVSENGESSSSILSKPVIKFMKAADSPTDSGCSRYMTGNISYLSNYEPYDGGHVSFGQGGGKITGKGIIKTGKLEFENVYFVKDLKYNLFSVS
nr:ribonuclease H-like domain-containing protein [Tanacetum cinerariifolium]